MVPVFDVKVLFRDGREASYRDIAEISYHDGVLKLLSQSDGSVVLYPLDTVSAVAGAKQFRESVVKRTL